jgi:FeS assembly SUF system regulator
MIRLTKMADYGIVVLSQFARSEDTLYSARSLAEATHLPLPTVSKLLKQLVQKSLLESHRGVSGGYRLARQAQRISVADIVEALDGPVALTECQTGECGIEANCQVRHHWTKLNRTVYQALAGLSLSELAEAPRARGRAANPSLVHLPTHHVQRASVPKEAVAKGARS